LPVLLYHHIGPPRPETLAGLTVAPDRFRGHLHWLRRRGYRSVSIDEVVGWATQGRPLPERRVLITFDDGYADLAEFAFPALRDAGLSAVVFIVTGRLGGTSNWDERIGGGGHRLLEAEAIAAWSRRGIEFGAHTRTHPHLTAVSASQLEREVAGSRGDLEAVVGEPVRSFAYPWGEMDAHVRAAVSAHFAIAFDCIGRINARGADPHRLERVMVLPTDGDLDIAMRVSLGFSPRQRAKARVARAVGRVRRRRQLAAARTQS
jgi:peptidoglycan/xylan/chitin deacetylase (PgdA/CDA1 family)